MNIAFVRSSVGGSILALSLLSACGGGGSDGSDNIVAASVSHSATHVGISVTPMPASLSDPRGIAVLPSGQLAILDGFAVLVTQGL